MAPIFVALRYIIDKYINLRKKYKRLIKISNDKSIEIGYLAKHTLGNIKNKHFDEIEEMIYLFEEKIEQLKDYNIKLKKKLEFS